MLELQQGILEEFEQASGKGTARYYFTEGLTIRGRKRHAWTRRLKYPAHWSKGRKLRARYREIDASIRDRRHKRNPFWADIENRARHSIYGARHSIYG